MATLNCVVVGDSKVGKTSLLNAHTSQCCSIWYHPNIFDTYVVNVGCGSELVTLKVWDTPGNDSVLSIKSRVNVVNVCLLCFAVDNDATYYNVKNKWYPEIQRSFPKVPIVLVGTRCELRDKAKRLSNPPIVKGGKIVTPQMSEQLRCEISAGAYIECSAIEKICLVELFEAVVRYASPAHKPTAPDIADQFQDLEPTELRSWLGGYADMYLYQEARRNDAKREHMVSRLSAAMYLDSLRSDTRIITSPPAWAVTGTDIDRQVSDVAFVKGARPLTLLSKEKTHQFLNAKRAAGVKIDAPPSWVTDSSTLTRFKEALRRKIPPRLLNSRTDTELFLLNIDGTQKPTDHPTSESSVTCGLFGWLYNSHA